MEPKTETELEETDAAGAWTLSRRQIAALGVAGVLCLAALVPVALRMDLKFTGDFVSRQVLHPQWMGLPIPFVLAALMVGLVLAALSRVSEWGEGRKARRTVGMLLAILCLNKFLLHVTCIVFLGEFSLGEAVWPFVQRLGDGAYNLAASQIQDPQEFLANYEKRFLAGERDPLTPHLETHPPGFVLFFYVLQEGLDSRPGLRNAIEKCAIAVSPILKTTLADAALGSRLYRHALAVSLSAAFLFMLSAALVPVGVYLLAREFADRPAAFAVAGACAFFPGTYCYNPGFDQALALPALLLCLFAVRSVRRRSAWCGFLFGLVAFGCLISSLAFLVSLGMLFWSMVAGTFALRAGKENRGRGLKRMVAEQAGSAGAAAAGFLAPALLLFLYSRFNLLTVLLACQRNNAQWHRGYGNHYWPWAAKNLAETAYSMGLAASLALLAGVLVTLRRAWKERSLSGVSPFFWGTHFCFALLVVSGVNLGEVARLWMFLFGILWAASANVYRPVVRAAQPERQDRATALWSLACFYAIQAAYVLVVRVNTDALECVKSFYNILGKANSG